MPRGDKSSYTDKQKRKAGHIEEGYEDRGVSHMRRNAAHGRPSTKSQAAAGKAARGRERRKIQPLLKRAAALEVKPPPSERRLSVPPPQKKRRPPENATPPGSDSCFITAEFPGALFGGFWAIYRPAQNSPARTEIKFRRESCSTARTVSKFACCGLDFPPGWQRAACGAGVTGFIRENRFGIRFAKGNAQTQLIASPPCPQ